MKKKIFYHLNALYFFGIGLGISNFLSIPWFIFLLLGIFTVYRIEQFIETI